jgi:hypothetical protein
MINRIYTSVSEPPKPPISKVINDGVFNSSGWCPRCHSTAVRKPWIFGKRYCINTECYNHYKPITKTLNE